MEKTLSSIKSELIESIKKTNIDINKVMSDISWLFEQAEKKKKYENALKKMSADIPGMVASETFDYKAGYYRLLKMVQSALKS